MSKWFTVAAEKNFPIGSWRVADFDDVSLLIFNQNGTFYATENLCTHDGGDLSEGHVEGDNIVCPRHGAMFCIKTGAVTAPPAYEDIRTFRVRILDGLVQVELEQEP